MRKYILVLFILFMAVLINSCGSDTSNPTGPNGSKQGSLFIQSSPSGAQIWSNNSNTGKVTPDSLTGLDAGNYSITLKSTGLPDTSFTATVTAGTKTPYNVTFRKSVQTYGPVRLWETVGTTAQQPSGLILSTGNASGIGSSATDRAKVDLYYSSTGFVLASADQASGLTRVTYFKVGSSQTLPDTVASPTKDATWVKSVKDTENNYIFVNDNDNHYSKLQIVNRGGGTPGNPAWLEVKWFYNAIAGDTRF